MQTHTQMKNTTPIDLTEQRFLDEDSVPFFKNVNFEEALKFLRHADENVRISDIFTRLMGITRPSHITYFMLHSLFKHAKRPDFRIEMGSYGAIETEQLPDGGGVQHKCVGCAAACVVQEAFGVNYVFENLNDNISTDAIIRATGVSRDVVRSVETFFDAWRRGGAGMIHAMRSLPDQQSILSSREFETIVQLPEVKCLEWMDNDNWRSMAVLYERAADRMNELGL